MYASISSFQLPLFLYHCLNILFSLYSTLNILLRIQALGADVVRGIRERQEYSSRINMQVVGVVVVVVDIVGVRVAIVVVIEMVGILTTITIIITTRILLFFSLYILRAEYPVKDSFF